MSIRPGEAPVHYFRRRYGRMMPAIILGGPLLLLLAIVVSLWLGKAGFFMTMVLGIMVGFVAMALLDHNRYIACPYCGGAAWFRKEGGGAWDLLRWKSPYGFEPTCRSCRADLTAPYLPPDLPPAKP